MVNQILLILAGALLGAYFSQLFQKKQWLYQRKIELFGKLLEVIHQQREKMASYAF